MFDFQRSALRKRATKKKLIYGQKKIDDTLEGRLL